MPRGNRSRTCAQSPEYDGPSSEVQTLKQSLDSLAEAHRSLKEDNQCLNARLLSLEAAAERRSVRDKMLNLRIFNLPNKTKHASGGPPAVNATGPPSTVDQVVSAAKSLKMSLSRHDIAFAVRVRTRQRDSDKPAPILVGFRDLHKRVAFLAARRRAAKHVTFSVHEDLTPENYQLLLEARRQGLNVFTVSGFVKTRRDGGIITIRSVAQIEELAKPVESAAKAVGEPPPTAASTPPPMSPPNPEPEPTESDLDRRRRLIREIKILRSELPPTDDRIIQKQAAIDALVASLYAQGYSYYTFYPWAAF